MYVLPFAAISSLDRPLVGNKGASLGELTRAGINVPPGFVVTTSAFDRFMREVDIDGAMRRLLASLDADDLEAVTAVATTVQQRIDTSPLPGDITEEIERTHSILTSADSRSTLAVRRSTDASFAGLQDSHLAVRGLESLSNCIRSCWASLFSTECVAYRLRQRPLERQLGMAVVIQRMVDATCSGIVFSRGPTGAATVTIQGCWGLGSWILDDEVTPDEFVVDRQTRALMSRQVAEKSIQHAARPEAGGVRKEAVPTSCRKAACLRDDEILALSDLALKAERHYGAPQYLEWAVGSQRTPGLFILHSRPDTA